MTNEQQIITNEQLQAVPSRLEILETELKKAKEKKDLCEVLSTLVLIYQEKDYQEYRENKQKKSFYLSNFIKNEFIIRSATAGCKKASIKLNAQAVRAITGLGFLVEDGSLEFSFKPLDKKTYLVSFKINPDKMSNGTIYNYNEQFNLNIPLNERKEVFPDEEQYDNNFTAFSVQKIIL